MSTDQPAVVIERTFDAPIDAVWNLWATPEGFASWYGPQGATIPTIDIDVTVGGKRHLCMAMDTPNGPIQMWFVGEYLEIDEPHRLVYTEAMSNEAGDVLAPSDMGMPADSPTSTTVTAEFTTTGDGTHLRLTHVGVPPDSPGAMGWQMAIDKLAAQLAG